MSYMNDAIIKEILESNPNFDTITYKNNTLEFNGQEINLENFSLVEIFGPYSELKEDVKKETMTASDLFKIIELNVILKNANRINEQQQEEKLESIKENTTHIKKINIIDEKDNGKYIHFVTDSNIDYILKGHNNKDIFETLMNIVAKKKNKLKDLSEKELYDELKRSLDDVALTNKNDSTHTEMMREELDRVDKKERNGSMALGNSKENLVVQNHQVIYYSVDKTTNAILEHRYSGNIEEDKKNTTIETTSNIKQVSNLISVLEYQSILESETTTQDDEDKLFFFYGFVEELYKYRYYLCEDGLNYLTSYESYIFNLMLSENLNNKEEEAVSKYEILASTKNRSEEINIDYINKLELDARRARNKDRAGYANSFLIVEIVILATFTLSSFIFLWLLN